MHKTKEQLEARSEELTRDAGFWENGALGQTQEFTTLSKYRTFIGHFHKGQKIVVWLRPNRLAHHRKGEDIYLTTLVVSEVLESCMIARYCGQTSYEILILSDVPYIWNSEAQFRQSRVQSIMDKIASLNKELEKEFKQMLSNCMDVPYISKESLAMLDESVENFKKGIVSEKAFNPNDFPEILIEDEIEPEAVQDVPEFTIPLDLKPNGLFLEQYPQWNQEDGE